MKGNSPLYSNCPESNPSLPSPSFQSSSPLHGQSQPFQELYSVYPKMWEQDVKNGVYRPGTGYIHNPTAGPLDSFIRGEYLIGPNATVKMPYVVTETGQIIIGKRNGFGHEGLQTPHPTLIGGLDPKVKMAGILHIDKGKIDHYDDRSGHYRPNIASMKYADEAFGKYPFLKRGGK